MKKTVALILIAFMGALSAYGLPISIEEAIEKALASNLELKKTALSRQTAYREMDNSWNLFLPSFSSGISLSRRDSFLLSGSSNGGFGSSDPWDLSVSLSVQLPLNLSIAQDLNQRIGDYDSALLNEKEYRAQITRNVQKNYYGLQTHLKNVEIKQNNLDLAQTRFKSVRQKFELGISSDLDLLKAEISVEQARLPYQRAVADYEKNLLRFKRIIGVELDNKIELVTSIEIKEIRNIPDQWIEKYLDSRFDIRRLNLNLQSSENQLTRNYNTSFIPGLSLSSSWGLGISQAFTSESWDVNELTDSLRLGLSLSIPLNAAIPGSKNNLALKSKEDALKKIMIDLEMTKMNAEDEIRAYARDLNIIMSNMLLSEKLLTLSRANYNALQKSFNSGESTLLQVEDAQNSFLSAQLSLLNIQFEYLSTLIDLGYALNTDWREF